MATRGTLTCTTLSSVGRDEQEFRGALYATVLKLTGAVIVGVVTTATTGNTPILAAIGRPGTKMQAIETRRRRRAMKLAPFVGGSCMARVATSETIFLEGFIFHTDVANRGATRVARRRSGKAIFTATCVTPRFHLRINAKVTRGRDKQEKRRAVATTMFLLT